MKIDWINKKVKLADVKEYEANPRTITEKGLKDLKQSIERFGQAEPLVVNTDMTLIGGHARKLALQSLDYEDCDVIIPSKKLTDKQVQELNIRLNKNIAGTFNFDILTEFFETDDLLEWGFESFEFENEVEQLEAKEDDYEAPDVIETNIVVGDLIEIGKHRLLCGDSTDSDQVERLMAGQKADCVVTDPPYNTGMKANKDEKAWLSHMFNDSFTDKEWEDFLTATFNNYSLFTKGECAFYVFIDWRRVSDIKKAVEQIADVKNVIVWDKGVHGLGSDYKSTYENCVVGKKGKPEINNRFGLDYQDIWRVQRTMGRVKEHATQKPLELLSKPIKHASKQDDIILDFFQGSGSTMVASHQLNRICYGLELDPKYCQVIIDRMLKLDNTLEVKINGKKYENK